MQGGVLHGLPKNVGGTQAPQHVYYTPISNVIQRIFLITIVSTLVYSFFGAKVETSFFSISSVVSPAVNTISWTITIAKDYILYPAWAIITYPFRWGLGGYLPKVDTSNIPIEAPDISIDLNKIFSTKNKDQNDLHDEIDDTKDEIPYILPELTSDISEQDAFKKGNKDITSSKEAKKVAYQYGRKKALIKYKSIGASSITPQEIAAAHIRGREEVLKQHALKGAASITPTEISEAFNNGKEQTLKSHILKGSQSLTTEEINNAFNSGKEQRQKEEFEKGLELTQQIQANAQDASHIALLRLFTNQTGDLCIIEKAMFYKQMNQCLKSYNSRKCLDNAMNSQNITTLGNILSDSKFEHVVQAQTLLKQMPLYIPYKKWFCDLMLQCQRNHDISYCLEETQQVTGMHYTNDDFCPPPLFF